MANSNSKAIVRFRLRHASAGAAAFVLAAALAAAPSAGQRTFATPEEAAHALVDAAAANDTAAMLQILGSGGKDIVVSGDPAADKENRADFARRAGVKLAIEIEPKNPDRAIMIIGDNDWPLPVPLVRTSGQWHFDAARGRVEVLARRVGRNEMNAIEVCRAYVEAQMEYAKTDHDGSHVLAYAQQIVSSEGKKDGLYFEGAPVPKSFADAAAVLLTAQGKKPVPYHGYFFHVVKAQGPAAQGGQMDYVVKGHMIGGFALIAWPAEYGVSGVKTFQVNHRGIVYEKDLGVGTASAARQMTRFNPDSTWKPIEGE